MTATAQSLGFFGNERNSFTRILKSIPLKVINDALKITDNCDKRTRLLPRTTMAYFVVFMAFHSDKSYTEVFRALAESKKNMFGPLAKVDIPAPSSIVEARQRLGEESMRHLTRHLLSPIAEWRLTKGAFFGKWRIVAIDGLVQNVQDTKANAEYFKRSRSQHGDGAYPQLRCVALVECGTRAVIDYELSTKKIQSEQGLAQLLLPRVKPDYLLIADRLYCDGKKWRLATERGAKAIFRAKADTNLPVEKKLSDGSYLSTLAEGDRSKASGILHPVRVTEHRIMRRGKSELIRLITNLTERQATPDELLALYRQRWEWEKFAKELKCVLNFNQDVLRSNTPDLVKQEFAGMILAHHSVKTFMHEAAVRLREDMDRLSFKHALSVVKRKAPQVGAFPP